MQHETLEDARTAYDAGYYKKQLKSGIEYQDFITKTLYSRGIVIVNYGSKLYQQKEGENILGAEIKHDKKFRDTGNLYIELKEKSHPDMPSYSPAGIYRKDNAWLYVIGDHETVWIFNVSLLRLLHQTGRYKEVKTHTSVGILLPISEADKYCGKKVEVGD